MAQMYPKQLDPETVSEAERDLYALFGKHLDDTYTVFHSARWQGLDAKGRPRDGEADFIIAHPQKGILVLEVKGGIVRYDSHRNQWISVRRDDGYPVEIQNPFEQALKSKHFLRERLQILLGSRYRMTFGHAVAFPDGIVPANSISADKPRDIILDCDQLADVGAWVNQVFTYWRGNDLQSTGVPGARGIDILKQLLSKSWTVRPVLASEFRREQIQLVQLTEQQYIVLDLLNQHRRARIGGFAGSGKTLLAAEKARRLVAQGFRVLVTCYNKALAAQLRSQTEANKNLDVLSFYELCERWARKAGVLPEQQEKKEWFRNQLPAALGEATHNLPDRYDAIIVDEGQDFRAGWWDLVQNLLRDSENSIFYIFYDDNQRIYKQHNPFPIKSEPYLLTTNCRNTQKIHQLVVKYFDGAYSPTASGPQGSSIQYEYYEQPDALRLKVDEVLIGLTEQEKIPAGDIAVLTPLGQSKSRLWDNIPIRGPVLTDRWPPPRGQVNCSSIAAFKGLEKSVILLTEIDEPWLPKWNKSELDQMLYIGCSRAQHYLIALLNRQGNTQLHGIFSSVGTPLEL